jgi:hypothetical protein
MQVSQAVVTAALPSIAIASDIKELMSKYQNEDSSGTFAGLLGSVSPSFMRIMNQHLADAVVSIGIDVTSDYGLAILSGAIMTAVFIVFTAALDNRSPMLVWQDYLKEARVI